MWKYVSRRIRDVCDRTYTVLDVRRPWQCGGERLCSENNLSGDQQQKQEGKLHHLQQNENPKEGSSYCLLSVAKRHLEVGREKDRKNDTGSNSSEREGFRRKEYCSFQHSWVGAITWTSAIICGWYTSQLICLYRRNHKWEGPKCLPFLIYSAHKIPRELKNTQYQSCFPFSSSSTSPLEGSTKQQQHQSQEFGFFESRASSANANRLAEFDFADFSAVQKNFLFQTNNEEHRQSKGQHHDLLVVNEGRTLQEQEPKPLTVESAMENLLSVIGEIEYQLGVQNLQLGDYATAVSHLKLGTSHQHAGAAFNLGICYEQGFGVKKNARVAMECYHMASTLGHAQAMYNLGVYYARGLGGLRRSRTLAKKYFTAAADLGQEEAIAALGPGYRTRRDSMLAGSSTTTTPSTVPFEFKFNYNDLEQYGFGGLKNHDQLESVEMRLVSAMA